MEEVEHCGGTFSSGAPGAESADAVASPGLTKVGFQGFLAHAFILGGTGTDAKALLSPIVAG